MSAAFHLVFRLLASGIVLVASSFGAILFQDSFESETPSLNASLSNWYIYRPGVDVVADDSYLIRCSGNQGVCVDLDGTYMQGAYMWSNSTFQFNSGFRYVLTLDLSGNQRRPLETDTVIIRLGNFVQTITLNGDSPWQPYTIQFDGDGSTGRIWFDMRGPDNATGLFGDNIGIVMDNLSLDEQVISFNVDGPQADSHNPEPASVFLMASGLGLLAWRYRRH